MRKILFTAGIAMSAFLIMLGVGHDLAHAEKTYTDLSTSHPNYAAIQYLSLDEVGVFEGYADGTFGPENEINRAELMKVLVESVYGTPDENVYKNCYPDVGTDWYAKYVCYATEQEWVEGYPDSTFKPENTVVKVEALKMLINTQGFGGELPTEVTETLYADTENNEWYSPYVALAKSYNFLEETGTYFQPAAEMDRAGVSEILFRMHAVLHSDADLYTKEVRDQLLTDFGLSDLTSSAIPEIGDPAEAVLGTLNSTNSAGRHGSYYLPTGYNLEPKPLLVLYHGTGGDGLGMVNYFQDLAEEKGFIIVAPDSRVSPDGDYTWQVGMGSGDISEDYTYTTTCIAEVEAMDGVSFDENFILAAGFSGGASSAPYYATNEDRFTHFAILHGGVFTSGMGDNVIPGWLATGEDDTLRTPDMMESYVTDLQNAGFTDLTYTVYPGGHELTEQERTELIEWWLGTRHGT